MYNRFAERRRRLLNECRGGIYTGMLLAGTQEPHFYKGLGYSQNCRVYGQRLCLLFSQISVFSVPTPLFLSAEICAIR